MSNLKAILNLQSPMITYALSALTFKKLHLSAECTCLLHVFLTISSEYFP